MLNATWLETFATLCDVGHFTRAATVLNMTQPGVSQHVKKLEAQLGQPLLTRDGKSFILTSAGEKVLDIAKRRRQEECALRDEMQHDDPNRGQVSVGCSGSLALLIYPRFIELMAKAAELSIHLEAMPQLRVIEGVVAGSIDLGIVDHSPNHPRLEGMRIGQDELCLLLPELCPVPRSFAELEALGFIAHPDGFDYADELLCANFPDEYSGADLLQTRSFINQIGQIPEPVRNGLGYTILPRSGLDAYLGRDQLVVMPLPVSVRHELWLIQRRNRSLPARTRRIANEIQEIVGESSCSLGAGLT